MLVPLLGGEVRSRSEDLNPQRCINLYPAVDKSGGRSKVALFGTPGTKLFSALVGSGKVRGMNVMGNSLFAVCGTKLYEVDTAGVSTDRGTIAGTENVSIANNGTEVAISNQEGKLYVFNGTTSVLAEVVDADYENSNSVIFIDGFMLVNVPNTQKVMASALYDASSWDALAFASSEIHPDDTVCMINDHREVWVFGKNSTEVWYNAGCETFPFDRIPGGVMEYGVLSKNCVAKIYDSIFWLTTNKTIVRANNYTPEIISQDIQYAIDNLTTWSDAIGFCYIQEGHTFYQITFPTDDITFTYDMTTGLWHSRQHPDGTRHRANCYALFNNKHIIGDYQSGDLYEWDLDTYTEYNGNDGAIIPRTRIGSVLTDEERPMFVSRIQVDMEEGVGNAASADPQAELFFSRDSGRTYTTLGQRSMGVAGNFEQRLIWNRVGRHRELTLKLYINEPVKTAIVGAYAVVDEGTRRE